MCPCRAAAPPCVYLVKLRRAEGRRVSSPSSIPGTHKWLRGLARAPPSHGRGWETHRMDSATRRPRRRPAPVGSPSRRGQREDVPLESCLFHLQPALLPRHKGACSEFHCIHLSLTAAPRNRECARVARPCIVQDAIISPPQVPMALVSALASRALGWYKCSMPASGRRKSPKPLP